MPGIETPHGVLHYDLLDATPPWLKEPETVLFHHGVGACAEIWSDWLPLLIGRYRLVRFDMRGCGRSALSDPKQGWSMENMLADVVAVADAAGAARFHIVGESLGGTVALYAGLQRPDRVASVTGISCSHRGSGIATAHEWEGLIAERGMQGWSERMMRHRFRDGALTPERHAWFEVQQAQHAPDVVLGLLRMLLAADLTGKLPDMKPPVLLLASDSSPFVGPDMTAEMHRLLPDSEMQVFAGTRHGLPFSHSGQCAAVVTDYLARHPIGSPSGALRPEHA